MEWSRSLFYNGAIINWCILCKHRLFQISPVSLFNQNSCTHSVTKLMCHETQNFEDAAQRTASFNQATYQQTTSSNVGMCGELLEGKSTKLPAPLSFIRGAKSRRSSLNVLSPSMNIITAHRATVGRMIAASECADWKPPESSSWDDALELLL